MPHQAVIGTPSVIRKPWKGPMKSLAIQTM